MKRTAKAIWKGSGPEGSGTLATQSGVFQAQPYSAKLRFQNEDGKQGTNPEELIAAALGDIMCQRKRWYVIEETP